MSVSEALSMANRLVKPVVGATEPIKLCELGKLDDLAAWDFSDTDICEAGVLAWRSPAYNHFNLQVERVYTRERLASRVEVPSHLVFIFTCKYEPTKCRFRRKRQETGRSGTSNMNRTIDSCNKRRGVSNDLTTVPEFPFSQLAFRVLLTLWCAVNHRPFNMLADPLFLEIVRLLRAEAIVPCPQTISNDLTYLYNLAALRISETFAQGEDGVHLAIDGWSSPLTASFLGVVVFWRQDGRIWRSVLEFIHLTARHTGAYMAEKTLECLNRFNVAHRIMSICLDNAKSNDTFIRHLAPHLPKFRGASARVRCTAHIINLIAKAFMGPFTRPTPKKRKAIESSSPTSKKSTRGNPAPVDATHAGTSATATQHVTATIEPSADEHSEPVSDDLNMPPEDGDESMDAHDRAVAQDAVLSVLNEMKASHGLHLTDSELREAQELFPKITGFAHRIHNNDVLYNRFKATRHGFKDQLNTRKEVPAEPCSTRWNSELACAEAHRDLREPIAAMTSTKSKKNDLTEYHLSPKQWHLLSEVFEEPTLLFSQKETPLLHEVIPSLRVLKTQLEMMRDAPDNELQSITRVAAQAALHVLNKYLKLMEASTLVWIAVVMCPWYKFDWFILNHFDSARIDKIRADTYELFSTYNLTPEQPTTTASGECSSQAIHSDDTPKRPWMHMLHNHFAKPEAIASTPISISDYLGSPAVARTEIEQAGGLLMYWSRELSLGSPLARMALDILSAPATSVDAERAFSGGRMAVNYRQHRMSLSTFRAKMAVGAWYGTPLLENAEEVMQILEGRGATIPEALDI